MYVQFIRCAGYKRDHIISTHHNVSEITSHHSARARYVMYIYARYICAAQYYRTYYCNMRAYYRTYVLAIIGVYIPSYNDCDLENY